MGSCESVVQIYYTVAHVVLSNSLGMRMNFCCLASSDQVQVFLRYVCMYYYNQRRVNHLADTSVELILGNNKRFPCTGTWSLFVESHEILVYHGQLCIPPPYSSCPT